jgi:hypothetical protein
MKLNLKIILVVGLLALAGLPACGEQLAILRNGFAIRHVRHEVRDDVTRLYLMGAEGSFVEVPTEEVERFEELEVPPPTLPKAVLENPTATNSVKEAISTASSRSRIDPDLIESMIRAESGFNAKAVSPKGAQGLMQLMPATAAQLGIDNAMDPVANVEGGTRYLQELLARYDDNLVMALAAYNAGPKRVEQYHGVPPYRETHSYVAKVIGDFNRKKIAQERTQEERAKQPKVRRKSENTAGKEESTRMRRRGAAT